MSWTLSALLAAWVRSLRAIADLHPAVFSVSDWSAPRASEGAQQRYSSADAPATQPEAEYPSANPAGQHALADKRPWPSAEQRFVDGTGKLIAK